MRALLLRGPRQAEVVEVPRPTPGPEEVLLRVRACGVCGSDLNAWRGVPGLEYPRPAGHPGHEVWGEVVEPAPGRGEVVEPAPGRGEAVEPARGGTVAALAQAGFAEFTLARADQVVPLPGALGERPFLGEPLACAANVVRRAEARPDDAVAVVGFGYLAALVVLLLDPARQRRWVAVSRRPDSRALAQKLGAAATYSFDDVPSDCWDAFPVVIEAAGVQHALDYASWLVAYGGRLVIAGYHADGPRSVNMQTWNWKGIDVVNAHERRPEVYLRGLRSGIETVRRHGLDLRGLISDVWPLEQAREAFTALEERPSGFIKAVLQP